MTARRKLNSSGFSRYDRQRMAFIAGIGQAVQEKCYPVSAWYYKGSLALSAHKRGLMAGRQALADLLERNGY